MCIRDRTEAALKAAKAHGVTVSVDLNFRKKLWSSEKAQKVMTNLMQYVDVCIGNEEDAEKVLGFKPGNTDVTSGEPRTFSASSSFPMHTSTYLSLIHIFFRPAGEQGRDYDPYGSA